MNSLAQQDRMLHMAAKKVVARMTAFAEKAASPSLRVALAVALQRQGAGNFDRQTRTKTVSQLLQVGISQTHWRPPLARGVNLQGLGF